MRRKQIYSFSKKIDIIYIIVKKIDKIYIINKEMEIIKYKFDY